MIGKLVARIKKFILLNKQIFIYIFFNNNIHVSNQLYFKVKLLRKLYKLVFFIRVYFDKGII